MKQAQSSAFRGEINRNHDADEYEVIKRRQRNRKSQQRRK